MIALALALALALVLVLGVEMPIAIGTSLLIIVANSTAGFLSHLHGLSVDWALAGAFAFTATVASLVAGQLGTRHNTDRLQRWFAYLVVDTIFLR